MICFERYRHVLLFVQVCADCRYASTVFCINHAKHAIKVYNVPTHTGSISRTYQASDMNFIMTSPQEVSIKSFQNNISSQRRFCSYRKKRHKMSNSRTWKTTTRGKERKAGKLRSKRTVLNRDMWKNFECSIQSHPLRSSADVIRIKMRSGLGEPVSLCRQDMFPETKNIEKIFYFK